MVSRQFTTLSLLMPVAMSIGTLMAIYAYKASQQGLSIVIIVGIVLLSYILFYTYGKSKRRS